MNRKAQNLLEYAILMVGFLTVLIVFLAPSGIFRKRLTETLDITVNTVNAMVDNLNFSN